MLQLKRVSNTNSTALSTIVKAFPYSVKKVKKSIPADVAVTHSFQLEHPKLQDKLQCKSAGKPLSTPGSLLFLLSTDFSFTYSNQIFLLQGLRL